MRDAEHFDGTKGRGIADGETFRREQKAHRVIATE